MAAGAKYVISEKLRDTDNLRIAAKSTKGVLSWIKKEHEFWSYVFPNELQGTLQPVKHNYLTPLNELVSIANNWNENPGHTEFKSQLIQRLQQFFDQQGALHSKQKAAQHIRLISDEDGESAAAAALASEHNWPFDQNNASQQGGIIRYIILKEGLEAKALKSAVRSWEMHNAEIEDATGVIIDAAKTAEQNLSASKSRYERSRKYMRRYYAKEAKKVEASATEQISAAIEKIETTEKTYTEFMKLKAAALYWEEKQKTHTENAEHREEILTGFLTKKLKWFVIALLALAGISMWVEGVKVFTFVSLIVLVATVAFWIARVLIRLYLSEHHLAVTAGERQTMITTYLALMNEGAASESEREIILSAIFAPTSDGIVKDDAAPNLGLASMLSKSK